MQLIMKQVDLIEIVVKSQYLKTQLRNTQFDNTDLDVIHFTIQLLNVQSMYFPLITVLHDLNVLLKTELF
jgi:hypothetical protein